MLSRRRSAALAGTLLAGLLPAQQQEWPRVSGRYPHLTVFNHQNECGIGALAVWADRLWAVTYAPHKPGGSDDKLYEIRPDLALVARPESVGGTPAGRLFHRESGQLLIGPYLIDRQRRVRVVGPDRMPGRITAIARHLKEPERKVYVLDMEGTLYELDVETLEVEVLFDKPVPGWHGKGAWTGQGRLVIANNGEQAVGERLPELSLAIPDLPAHPENVGILADWDGDDWRIASRRQHCEVTGPGDVHGATSPDAPVWATGWERRSVLLHVLEGGEWRRYRLPKACFSYDGRHGWHTEWPRIRQVDDDLTLMTMHGQIYDFPRGFSHADAAGIRPLGAYLKIVVDVCRWNDELVFACDDVSRFANPLVNQSQSNLWFARPADLERLGRPRGWGGPWLGDEVDAGSVSDPYLFAGFDQRCVHVAHGAGETVKFTFEIDVDGRGSWRSLREIAVPARGYAWHAFPGDVPGEWIRVRVDRRAPAVTVRFHYGPSGGAAPDPRRFAALADAAAPGAHSIGVLRPRGGDLGTLHLLAQAPGGDGAVPLPVDYFEMGPELQLQAKPDEVGGREYLREHGPVRQPDFDVDDASVIVQWQGRRYRLPKGDSAYDTRWPSGWPRGVREVVTERSLWNAHGTFYVLPRDSSGGVPAMVPVATHGKRIGDYASWRGMLAMTGVRADAREDGHVFRAERGPALWLGDVDDLWASGKPRGHGGPWQETRVAAGVPSDPYLMTGFDRKSLVMSHDADRPVRFAVEVDVALDGIWHRYGAWRVPPGEGLVHVFPVGFQAHWVRVVTDAPCRATASFRYE